MNGLSVCRLPQRVTVDVGSFSALGKIPTLIVQDFVTKFCVVRLNMASTARKRRVARGAACWADAQDQR